MTIADDSATARNEIDQTIDALEDFCSDDTIIDDEKIDCVTRLMGRFRFGRNGTARFVTLEQVERVTHLLPPLLARLLPKAVELRTSSEAARTLFQERFPQFVANVGKLARVRERQSASGRGAFGRETLAQLREKNARLEAEVAELRAKEEHEAETA